MAEDPGKWSPLAQPMKTVGPPLVTQACPEAFGDLAQQAFELNKGDMSGRGAAMSKATMTAILLRDLYQGSPGRAKKKISHEFKNKAEPFIAPGVRQLLDFDKFDKQTNEFPGDSGVDWLMLTLAVEHGKYPKELILMDKGTPFRGWEVIKKLTEPLPPEGWDIPEKPADISMLKLWWKWLTWWE